MKLLQQYISIVRNFFRRVQKRKTKRGSITWIRVKVSEAFALLNYQYTLSFYDILIQLFIIIFDY